MSMDPLADLSRNHSEPEVEKYSIQTSWQPQRHQNSASWPVPGVRKAFQEGKEDNSLKIGGVGVKKEKGAEKNHDIPQAH